MAEPVASPTRGLLDTSVVIDMDRIDVDLLPDESAIATITLAELAAGPHGARSENERANRQDRLQWATQTWDPLPFDTNAARMYGRVYSAMRVSGRSARSRPADLLIAAIAASNELALYTRTPSDFVGLEQLLCIKTV